MSVDKIGCVRGEEYGRTLQILRTAPAGGRGFCDNKLVKRMPGAVRLSLAERRSLRRRDTPYADMIKNIKKGIIVGRFSGGNPGPNGDFSGIAKNSFLIEDGEIKGAVSETMINGNLAEMLQNVVAVSKETIADGNCVLPYVAVDKIVISGK